MNRHRQIRALIVQALDASSQYTAAPLIELAADLRPEDVRAACQEAARMACLLEQFCEQCLCDDSENTNPGNLRDIFGADQFQHFCLRSF